MSICFEGYGWILLKEGATEEFVKSLTELLRQFDINCEIKHETKYIQFKNYARHHFMAECKKILEENISMIEGGRLYFDCNDEDGTVKSPFPYRIAIEIAEGQIFEEQMLTRLPFDMFTV